MALPTRLRMAVASRSASPNTWTPGDRDDTISMARDSATSRDWSMAAVAASATSTSTGSCRVSAICSRERSTISWTRLVSRVLSTCIRRAKRATALGSSLASRTASDSSTSPPTGVLSSWLTLTTKSRRTSSTRRAVVRSSTSRRMKALPSGATRTPTVIRPRPSGPRARSRSSSWTRLSSRTSPYATAQGLVLTTASAASSTIAPERSTARTAETPGGSAWGSAGCGTLRCDRSDRRTEATVTAPMTRPSTPPRTASTVGSTRLSVLTTYPAPDLFPDHQRPGRAQGHLLFISTPKIVHRWVRLSAGTRAARAGIQEGNHAQHLPRGPGQDLRPAGRDDPTCRVGHVPGDHGTAGRRPAPGRDRHRRGRADRRVAQRPGRPRHRPAGASATSRHRPSHGRHRDADERRPRADGRPRPARRQGGPAEVPELRHPPGDALHRPGDGPGGRADRGQDRVGHRRQGHRVGACPGARRRRDGPPAPRHLQHADGRPVSYTHLTLPTNREV